MEWKVEFDWNWRLFRKMETVSQWVAISIWFAGVNIQQGIAAKFYYRRRQASIVGCGRQAGV